MMNDPRSNDPVEVIPPEKVEILPPASQPPSPARTTLLPVLGAALLWTGREILPRLAHTALAFLDRHTAPPAVDNPSRWTDAPRQSAASPRARGWGGRRNRRRQRQGGRGKGRGC